MSNPRDTGSQTLNRFHILHEDHDAVFAWWKNILFTEWRGTTRMEHAALLSRHWSGLCLRNLNGAAYMTVVAPGTPTPERPVLAAIQKTMKDSAQSVLAGAMVLEGSGILMSLGLTAARTVHMLSGANKTYIGTSVTSGIEHVARLLNRQDITGPLLSTLVADVRERTKIEVRKVG